MDREQDAKPYMLAAKASWVAFGSALVTTVIGNQIGHRAAVDVIVLACVLTGAMAGIVALVRMPRTEAKKNLLPILISLVLNALIMFIWITNVWRALTRTQHGG